MLQVLVFITLRQWRIHKLRTALTLVGIALGVAVYFAVRTANVTLIDSLKLTAEKISGRATLQVSAGESGIAEETLEIVRSVPGVAVAEPVIEVIAHTGFSEQGNILIAGVDITGDREIHQYQFDESHEDLGDPLLYLAQPDSIMISRAFGERHGLKEGDKLPLYTSHGRKDFTVRGIFKPIGIGEVFGGNVAVMDVYSAQFVFNRGRNFDRIEIMTAAQTSVEEVRDRLRRSLPDGLTVDRPSSRGEDLEKAVAALRQGLTTTSFVALLVGLFMIFNSFSIAVNQRWKEIGVLRALGVERPSIQRMFLGEAVLMGAVGSLIGLVSGFFLASGATRMMGQIVATVYARTAPLEPPAFHLSYAAVSIGLGILSSLLAAWFPARAAARLNPVLALHDIETRQREAVLGWPRLLAGLGLSLAGVALVRYAPLRVGKLYQFIYVAMILLGFVAMLPKLAQWLALGFRAPMDWAFGSEGVLAVDTMIHSPRRTSATVGAVMIGLTFVFATGAYIQSNRRVITRWMNRAITADLEVTASVSARSPTYHLSEALGLRISALEGVKRVENIRFTFVPYRDDQVALMALEMEGWLARVNDPIEEGDEKKARALMPRGEGVLVARNFATRWDVGVGDHLKLETPMGPLDLPILGVVENYSSEKGTIFMDRALYKRFWRESGVDYLEVNLLPGANRSVVKRTIEGLVAGDQHAFVFTNEEYKQWVLGLVNQFFVLNYIQMVVAIFVAVLGIVNTLIISVSERQREIGVLRAIGGFRVQIRNLVLLEAMVIAIIGVLMGAVANIFTTYFLVRTASTLFAGYTVPFAFPYTLILVSLPVMAVVAASAAWWPARQAVEVNVVRAIGYE